MPALLSPRKPSQVVVRNGEGLGAITSVSKFSSPKCSSGVVYVVPEAGALTKGRSQGAFKYIRMRSLLRRQTTRVWQGWGVCVGSGQRVEGMTMGKRSNRCQRQEVEPSTYNSGNC